MSLRKKIILILLEVGLLEIQSISWSFARMDPKAILKGNADLLPLRLKICNQLPFLYRNQPYFINLYLLGVREHSFKRSAPHLSIISFDNSYGKWFEEYISLPFSSYSEFFPSIKMSTKNYIASVHHRISITELAL